ncbi:hypothetical protein [Luteimonas sp. gir]|uniref:OB-fold protein n=1 Tax=Luteimonas sp. gir TaxID=3127960 RepID=UPI003075CC88
MNTATISALRPAPVTATWICLAIAWGLFLLPVPGLGLFVGWPLNLVAFILAVVVMTRGRTAGGLIPLLASIVISPIIYFIGLAIFGAAIGGSGYDDYKARAEAAQTRAVEPVQVLEAPVATVDAQALYAAYNANEVSADNEFKGKRLAVTGIVSGINKDFMDKVYVEIETGQMFQSIHARGLSPDVAAALQKGQGIEVECTGAGLMVGSPILDNCELR